VSYEAKMDDDSSDLHIQSTFLSAISGDGTERSETDLNSVDSIQSSKQSREPRTLSSIHKHTRPADSEEKSRTKKNYFCKYCSSTNSKGHHQSTTGLKHHLKKEHNILWDPTENQNRTVRDEGQKTLIEYYQKFLERGELQGLRNEILRRTVNKDLMKQALVDLVVRRRVSLSIVEWSEFHTLIGAANPEAPSTSLPTSHQTVANWILQSYTRYQDIVRKILQSAQTNIHLAVDIWTSPESSLLLGICGSFVDHHDDYRNILIGLRTVKSQSGENQWKTLLPVLKEYGIETKIGAIIGDNAQSNDVLCRTMAQWLSLEYKINWNAKHQRLRCLGHIINLIVQAFLFDSKKDKKLMKSYDDREEQEKEPKVDTEEEESEKEVIVVRQTTVLSSSKTKTAGRRKKKNEDYEPVDLTSTPVSSTASNETKDSSQIIREILGPLGKLHNLVVHMGRGNRPSWFKEKAGRSIPLDNRTRWNSWFSMLNVALQDKIKLAILEYMDHYECDISKDDNILTEEWKVLRTIHEILESFNEATQFLQGNRTTLERVLDTMDTIQRMMEIQIVSKYFFLLLLFS
jgi:hypothetical protein